MYKVMSNNLERVTLQLCAEYKTLLRRKAEVKQCSCGVMLFKLRVLLCVIVKRDFLKATSLTTRSCTGRLCKGKSERRITWKAKPSGFHLSSASSEELIIVLDPWIYA
jgi:hypothetical protein